MAKYQYSEQGVSVKLKYNESPENLIKRFKKKFMKSGITQECRQRMFYEKPSDKRRRRRREGRNRILKELKKEQERNN